MCNITKTDDKKIWCSICRHWSFSRDVTDTKRGCNKHNCETKAWETCDSFSEILCDTCGKDPEIYRQDGTEIFCEDCYNKR